MSMETNRSSADPVVHPPAPPHPNPRYEMRDADVSSLAKFAFGLAIVLVAVFFVSRWTFDYFGKVQQLGPPVSPFEEGNFRTLPPEPRLQVAPQSELLAYCQKEQQALTSYGWIDRPNGVVRVPIDRAMKTLLSRGLPARAGADDAAPQQMESHPEAGVPPAGIDGGPCGYLVAAEAAKTPPEERGEKSGDSGAAKKE